MTIVLALLAASCGMKTINLPFIDYPYAAGFEFYQRIENVAGKLEKTEFEDDKITSPFYFLLEVKEIENSGTMTVLFYDSSGKKVAQRAFHFGEQGQYYEYILFFDKIDGLPPGNYRFTVFYNASLLYEDRFTIARN